VKEKKNVADWLNSDCSLDAIRANNFLTYIIFFSRKKITPIILFGSTQQRGPPSVRTRLQAGYDVSADVGEKKAKFLF